MRSLQLSKQRDFIIFLLRFDETNLLFRRSTPMVYRNVLSSLLLVFWATISGQENPCNYFGLSQPDAVPQDFNPDFVDLDGSFKFNVELSGCDELFITAITSSESIYYSKKTENSWSSPKRASFSHPKYNDADPFLTKDGKRIYFISKRPTYASDTNLDYNIWYANRNGDDWTPPQPLPKPINSDDYDEYFFSISNKGHAFFSSNRPGGEGSFDIYIVKILGDLKFSDPVNVGRPLCTEKYEFDPYIAPDERFMVYSINENGNSSLYVSHKNEQGKWTKARNLGRDINVTDQDFAPSLSPDGKFLFYSNNGKLRWVSTDILKSNN